MKKIYAYTKCNSLDKQECKSDNYHVIFIVNNKASFEENYIRLNINEVSILGEAPLYIKISKLISCLVPRNGIEGIIIDLEKYSLNDDCANKDNMIKIIVTTKEIK
jgi:hypothetical protein